jgi:RNA polymerase sigma-70 factor (ECF subfamily)
VARSDPAGIFARHHQDVYRYLVRMTGRRDVADDLSQEVFLRVVRALANGGPVSHERGWIFSIARNLLADHHRRADVQGPLVENAPDPAQDGTQALAFDLARSFARLAEPDRDVFLLKEVGGLSYEEIAEVCDCTVEGVRARLRRTRVALRAMLTL